MELPSFNTTDRILSMMQSAWATMINPVLSSLIVQGRQIPNVSLVTGTNTIDHKLSRKLQGYIVTTKSANVTIYDLQTVNTMPDKTLQLVASGPAVITLWCY